MSTLPRSRGGLPWWYWRSVEHRRRRIHGVTYGAEVTAFGARTAATASQKAALDTLVTALKACGWYSFIDAMWFPAPEFLTSGQTVMQNLIQDAFHASRVGTLTVDTKLGSTGNGSTGYWNSGLNPSTYGGQWVQNGGGILVETDSTASADTIEIGNTHNSIVTKSSSAGVSIRSSNATGDTTVSIGDAGIWSSLRTASNSYRQIKNGVSLATKTTVSASPASANVYLGARNNAGTPATLSAKKCRCWAIYGLGPVANILARDTAIATCIAALAA